MDEIKSLSDVFKLLGEPNRLRILLSLGLECRPVSAVIAATERSNPGPAIGALGSAASTMRAQSVTSSHEYA